MNVVCRERKYLSRFKCTNDGEVISQANYVFTVCDAACCFDGNLLGRNALCDHLTRL